MCPVLLGVMVSAGSQGRKASRGHGAPLALVARWGYLASWGHEASRENPVSVASLERLAQRDPLAHRGQSQPPPISTSSPPADRTHQQPQQAQSQAASQWERFSSAPTELG